MTLTWFTACASADRASGSATAAACLRIRLATVAKLLATRWLSSRSSTALAFGEPRAPVVGLQEHAHQAGGAEDRQTGEHQVELDLDQIRGVMDVERPARLEEVCRQHGGEERRAKAEVLSEGHRRAEDDEEKQQKRIAGHVGRERQLTEVGAADGRKHDCRPQPQWPSPDRTEERQHLSPAIANGPSRGSLADNVTV